MSYQIPQNLKYEEKIIFGLSFKQLIWVGLFGGIAALIFFKSNLILPVKIGFTFVFCLLGIGFAFLNLFSKLKDFIGFRRGLRKAGYFDPRLSKFVGVKSVEDNAVFLLDGGIIGVLEVTPLNFELLSQNEKQAIVCAYKNFLNSLDFPAQVMVRTVDLCLDDYLNVLKRKVSLRKSHMIIEQFDSFNSFVQDFVKNKKVKNRLFYLIVPVYPNYSMFPKNKNSREETLNKLNIRLNLCQQKLWKSNLLSKRLNSDELVSLVSSFFSNAIVNVNNYFSLLTVLKKSEKQSKQRKLFDVFGERISTKKCRSDVNVF